MDINKKIKTLNSVLSTLTEMDIVSKGTIGSLLGDKAELALCKVTNGRLARSNQNGFDLIGSGFLSGMKAVELRYEVKIRRTGSSCNIERSKFGKFDIAIIIFYDEEHLDVSSAFALEHDAIERIANEKRAVISEAYCKNHAFNFSQLLQSVW